MLRRTGLQVNRCKGRYQLNTCSWRFRRLVVVRVMVTSEQLLTIRKCHVPVFRVFLVTSSLTFCWMCKSSTCFVHSSCSTSGFSKVLLFFLSYLWWRSSMRFLVFAPALSCRQLAMLVIDSCWQCSSCSFHRFTCCWVCSFGSSELLAY